MSLRLKVALVAAAAAALVSIVAGLLVVQLTTRDTGRQLDQRLIRRAAAVQGPLARVAGTAAGATLAGTTGNDLVTDQSVRVVGTGGGVLLQLGADLGPGVGLLPPGFSTVSVDGQAWRVYTLTPSTRLPSARARATGEQLQVAAALSTVDDLTRTIRRRTLTVGGLAVLGALGLAWLLAGPALAPLGRLRRTAEEVARTRDLTRRVAPPAEPEVAEVADAFNVMLQRLQLSAAEREQVLATARGFAADVTHELRTPLTSMAANLELLADEPDRSASVVDDLRLEHARLVRTLDALIALARAELAPAPTEEVDLADLVAVAGQQAPRRHPQLHVTFHAPEEPVEVLGSREGLRILVDNLLDNAARHAQRGDRPVSVGLRLARCDGHWALVVDDDGPGFPTMARDRLLQRFERGGSTVPGSGLGLAVVAEQTRLHGGGLELLDSPQGGARVVVRLPALG